MITASLNSIWNRWLDGCRDIKDAIAWTLWHRWAWQWRHRNDTFEQRKQTLWRAWDEYLAQIEDKPATRELHDAIDTMNAIRHIYGGNK